MFIFSVRFCVRVRVRVRIRVHHRCNDFCFSRQNRLSFTLHIWDKQSIGLGKCTGWPLVTLTQGHGCGIDKHKFACLQEKVRTTHPITTKLGSDIPLVVPITWLDFRGVLLETLFFLQNFLWKFWMCFFKVKHSIGHISGIVGTIDVKRKGAPVGYWVNYVTLTFDLTHDLDLVVSRSKFEIALFEKWGADWHGTKGMWVDHSWPWPWPMGNHGGVGGCTV